MAFGDRIKKLYQKADTKLGGYLPGASTPSEVKASKAVATPTVPVTPQGFNPVNQSVAPTQPVAPTRPVAPTNTNPVNTSIYSNKNDGFTYNDSAKSWDDYRAEGYNSLDDLRAAGILEPEAPKTFGDKLRDEYNYYKPVAGLVFAEAGATEAVFKGAVNLIRGYKVARLASKNTREATKLVTNAEKVGNEIVSSGKLYDVGEVITTTGKTATNNKMISKITDLATKASQEVSPKNWQKLIGFAKGTGGNIVTGIAISELIAVNLIMDNIDRLGISAGQVADAGDLEGAQELWTLQEEAAAFAKRWTSYIPGAQIITSGNRFINDSITASNLKRDAVVEKQEKESVIAELVQKGQEGTITEDERELLDDLAGPNDYAAQDVLKDEITAEVDTAGLAEGDALVSRIFTEGFEGGLMSDEQIVNDPAIRAHVLDPRNQFSAVKKIYDQALARYVAAGGNVEGSSSTSSIEPGSTLGFGLLNTGSQYIEGEEPQVPVEPTQEPQVSPQPTNPSLPGARDERIDDGTQTQTGFPPNTYDEATHTYTDSQGQGYSMAQAPPGVRIL